VTPRFFATDLDGTLLDAGDYSWEAARPALVALRDRGLPLALCSSKTRAEMEALARSLPTRGPLVVENGAALVDPALGTTRVFGRPRSEIVAALAVIAAEAGADVRGFASLSIDELQALTGLGREDTERALRREHDEPFVLEDASLAPALSEAARRRGLAVCVGGRFLHLAGNADKGSALAAWLAAHALHPGDGVALGDAPNDVPLLRAVGRPILVPRPDGSVDARLRAALPGAEQAPGPGPAGWDKAVLAVLAGERLSQG
jgi:mannosyl-3-phosphoglycerate phosphatase